MNELHGIGIRDITSPFNDKFHKEQTWACLDIIDETCEPSQWCLTSFLLVPKCVCPHHTMPINKILDLKILESKM
jgi:hypothetical protein